MKKNEQYRVDNDKEVIFTGVYPGDTIINEATRETWIVDMYKPYVAGDRTLRSLILGAYVIPYTVAGSGTGTAPTPTPPAQVFPFDVIIETSDHAYEPYHVEGGTLTKTHLSGTRYRFTSTDPIDAVQFGKMYQMGDDSVTEIEIIKYTPTSSCKNMLADLELLHTVDLSGLDTSNVTDMSFMFNGCSEAHTLDLHSFNTAKVTNMSGMFFHCEMLHTLNVSSFNVHNVTDMSFMFNDCTVLASLDLTSFHMNKVANASRIFENCRHLVCITNIDTSKITDSTKRIMMFDGCHALVAPDATEQTAIMAGTHWINHNACP